MADPSDRTDKLNKIYNNIVFGRQKLGRLNFKQFLEAICVQDDRAACVTRLSNANPPLLQEAFRMELAPVFINGPITSVLLYLQDPKLKEISGGAILHDLLIQIVDPPIFWSAFQERFRMGELTRDGELSFAFVLHDLVSNPASSSSYRPVAQDPSVMNKLRGSAHQDIRTYAYKIKQVLETFEAPALPATIVSRPGGRHDNDFADFRQIAIMPTADEIRAIESPFLLPSTAFEKEAQRSSIYLDTQFRLLREDMLSELRDEVQIALGQKQGKRRGRVITNLKLVNVFSGDSLRRQKWSLVFECSKDLWVFETKKPIRDRLEFLKKECKSIRHLSLSCLSVDGEVVAFPLIIREEPLIARKLPQIPLQFGGETSTILALERMKSAQNISLLLIDTAVFAYEPVLRALQQMTSVPLQDELLYWDDNQPPRAAPEAPASIINALERNQQTDLGTLLGMGKSIVLDPAQAASLTSALKQRVSLIQGPPGTGKSFIGAILAKVLHDFTSQTILVCCYTNHALDQFLEDLIDVGIPRTSIVREFRQLSEQLVKGLELSFKSYLGANVSLDTLMQYLEFEDPEYFEAFQVPADEDGLERVGRDGRAIGATYLLDQWTRQQNGGIFAGDPVVTAAPQIWKMSRDARSNKVAEWFRAIYRERAEKVYNSGHSFNQYQDLISQKYVQADVVTLKGKRVIACTTTGAAKYGDSIRGAAPGVLLIEEAGEILESHVLTAMNEDTAQIIAIGDHQQLRPKVSSYQLTVEKGEGYDLNVSLFERLVRKGYPHHSLLTQHRMRPEISSLIRALTYPDLRDSAKTAGRPNLRGVRDNIMFIRHSKPEDENRKLSTHDTPSYKSSKQNTYEAQMLLKILHYLGQQGYGTDRIVILTPYLGQLKQLQDALRNDLGEPIMSDLDVQDLIRAGVDMPMAAQVGKTAKKAVRISTIDNYQGEENDIVLASLTRSNPDHDIGFMFAPERLNVLISRARDALIMIGNDDTFRNARKGSELWRHFFDLLEKGKHIYDGFPTVCERHRTREVDLRDPAEFKVQCPNGGCTQAWTPASGNPSEDDWAHRKAVEGKSNEHVDRIMALVGLEAVKQQVLSVMDKIEVVQQQGTSLKDQRFNVAFLGNPGTGKTTVARHYAKFLTSMNVLPGDVFLETTGSQLASEGQDGVKKKIEAVLKAGGGAIFVDEAYQLTTDYDSGGRLVLDLMLAEMENHTGKLLFILAGYNKEMEKFFEHNPGLKSRVPQQFQFEDYSDEQLMDIMERRLVEKYRGRLVVEDGMRGLYSRVAIRRVGRGRGRPGFGNARALQNMLDRVTDRQAKRVARERRQGVNPDVFYLSKDDLVVDPTTAMKQSKALQDLHSLTGLRAVKDAVDNFVQLVVVNYKRELLEKEPIMVPLNRVFLGSPGTGKTTVAKLYGQILADLAMLSNGEVVVKNPSDFIGQYVGASEQNTKNILAATIGKVLVIDEAYMLGGSSKDGGNQTDSFKTGVIDTIVAEVQNVPGDDRCVLLLGYDEEMNAMFQNVNPGLARRFQLEDAFHFEDFSMAELMDILDQKMRKQELDATDAARKVAQDVLDRARNRPKFGNGGEVENLLGRAKQNYQTRHNQVPVAQRPIDTVFEPVDFDKDFDRAAKAGGNLTKMFEGIIGCDHIVKKIRDYQNIAQVRKAQNKDPKEVIPMNFVFKGPPGTGKTTVARKMGQIYFDMGFLGSSEVVECSASDLVGQYVGHTGPKTQKLFEKALGKVLFIDEAYRLASGNFAQEAMDEIVTVMTQEKFKGKLIVILAGYEHDINNLMSSNSGLSSRFPEEIMFYNLGPDDCLDVLRRQLEKEEIRWDRLSDKVSVAYAELKDDIEAMASMPSWGNARDIGTIAQSLTRLAYTQGTTDRGVKPVVLDDAAAMACLREFAAGRRSRAANLPRPDQRRQPDNSSPMASASASAPPPPPTKTQTNTATKKNSKPRPKPPPAKVNSRPPTPQVPSSDPGSPSPSSPSLASSRPSTPASSTQPMRAAPPLRPQAKSKGPADTSRDPGVPDHIWNELQAAKQARQREEIANRVARQKLEQQIRTAEKVERERQEQLRVLQAKAEADRREQRRVAELQKKMQRAREEEERRRRELEERKRREQEEKRKHEQAMQKLRRMGVCVAGFQWYKMPGGYRCGGGSHFVSDAQLR
uniref:AAA+ ATPase domain-containing protein n=1 Tax=Schizophyllum commune (strain H4-8 / FGSC 9210) TaxID=578458 RepID=D8QIN5_SCHCM